MSISYSFVKIFNKGGDRVGDREALDELLRRFEDHLFRCLDVFEHLARSCAQGENIFGRQVEEHDREHIAWEVFEREREIIFFSSHFEGFSGRADQTQSMLIILVGPIAGFESSRCQQTLCKDFTPRFIFVKTRASIAPTGLKYLLNISIRTTK